MNVPSAADIETMEKIGLKHDPGIPVRDAGDIMFVSDWFDVVPADGDVEDAFPVRFFAYFEPEQVGGVADNWNCGVELEGDFRSANGGDWPDCFDTAEQAAACISSYTDEAGVLLSKWKVV